MVFHFSHLECVPESGAASGLKIVPGFVPGFAKECARHLALVFAQIRPVFVICTTIPEVLRTSIMSRFGIYIYIYIYGSQIGPGRALKRNSKRSLQHGTKKKQHIMFAYVL